MIELELLHYLWVSCQQKRLIYVKVKINNDELYY